MVTDAEFFHIFGRERVKNEDEELICSRCATVVTKKGENVFIRSVNCYWAGHKPEEFVTREEWEALQKAENG